MCLHVSSLSLYIHSKNHSPKIFVVSWTLLYIFLDLIDLCHTMWFQVKRFHIAEQSVVVQRDKIMLSTMYLLLRSTFYMLYSSKKSYL